MPDITKKQARKLILNSQRMYSPQEFGKGPDAVIAALEHLSYVQIDTISVVERAHHHTLWNRIKKYQPDLLDKAVAQRRAFEYWSHAAAYLPMRDFRFSLPAKKEFANGGKHWYPKDPKQAKYVLDKIRSEGPLQASDFKQARSIKGSGWGDQKPAKRALDRLFMDGELMVSHRKGFQKVFDLAERVVPTEVDTRFPSEQENLDYLIFSALRANGLATATEIAYLRKGIKNAVHKRCLELLEDKQLIILRCGVKQYFALADFDRTLAKRSSQCKTKILSPFDNVLIQRQRMRDFFDFDYQIECYVPEAKRQYGYFVLPILMGQSFIGRMDAKINRADKTLHIKSTFFDLGNIKSYESESFQCSLKKALQEFLKFNNGQKFDLQSVFLNGKSTQWMFAIS